MPHLLEETGRFFTTDNLVGRDLEINFRGSGTLYRGPIQFATVIHEEGRFGVQTEFIVLTLEWLAVRYNPSRLPFHSSITPGPWAKYDGSELLTQKICLNYLHPTFAADGVAFHGNGHSMRVLNNGAHLSKDRIYGEFHIAARIRHSLYPPHPFEEMLCVGTVENVSPQEVKSQAEVEITEITFVVYAKSYESACTWVRAECARLELPVISLRKSHLVRGW